MWLTRKCLVRHAGFARKECLSSDSQSLDVALCSWIGPCSLGQRVISCKTNFPLCRAYSIPKQTSNSGLMQAPLARRFQPARGTKLRTPSRQLLLSGLPSRRDSGRLKCRRRQWRRRRRRDPPKPPCQSRGDHPSLRRRRKRRRQL